MTDESPSRDRRPLVAAVTVAFLVGAGVGCVALDRYRRPARVAAEARLAAFDEQLAGLRAELEAEQAAHEETRAEHERLEKQVAFEHGQQAALAEHLGIGRRRIWQVREREAPWPKGRSRGAKGRWVRDQNLRHVGCVRRLAERRKGLQRVMNDEDLRRLAKAGKLVPATGKRYTLAPKLAKDRELRLLRPEARRVLEEVARRFQRRVRDHGGPRGAKLELISALRTHEHNVRQGRSGDSTHEWGLAFDLGHRPWRFEVPGARVCQRDANKLQVVLGRLLARMQEEGRLRAFEHDGHFHVTACGGGAKGH